MRPARRRRGTFARQLGNDARSERLDRALIALQGPKAEAALQRSRLSARRCASWTCGADLMGAAASSRVRATRERTALRSRCRPMSRARSPKPCSRTWMLRLSVLARATRCGWRPDSAFMAPTSMRTTTPVEAGLSWAIQKARRRGGAREAVSRGRIILDQIEDGPPRRRVGLRPEGRAPVRAGASIFAEWTRRACGNRHVGRLRSQP